jgi:hypothetical protein
VPYDWTMEKKNLIKKSDAARRAGKTERSIDNYLREGKLTKHVNGLGQVRIDAEELEQLLTFVPVVVSSDL